MKKSTRSTQDTKSPRSLAIPKETVNVLGVRTGVRGGASSYKPSTYKASSYSYRPS